MHRSKRRIGRVPRARGLAQGGHQGPYHVANATGLSATVAPFSGASARAGPGGKHNRPGPITQTLTQTELKRGLRDRSPSTIFFGTVPCPNQSSAKIVPGLTFGARRRGDRV